MVEMFGLEPQKDVMLLQIGGQAAMFIAPLSGFMGARFPRS
jgi:hypothetical protein